MTEQLGEPKEPQSAASATRYENELLPERFVCLMKSAGTELTNMTFRSPDDAREAGREFCSRWQDKSDSFTDLKSMVLRAEGDGMYVSNTTYEEDDYGNVLIQHMNEPMLRPLDPMSNRRFQYQGLFSQLARSRISDDYGVVPFIIGNDVTTSRRVQDMRLGFPLTRVVYQSTVLVPCANEVEIESVNLRQERHRVSAMNNLQAYTQHYPDIVNDLAQIDKEIFESRGSGGELRHVGALRELGVVGVKFSALSLQHEDALNSAIATTLGEGRPLVINGSVYSLDEANDLTLHIAQSFRGILVNVIANPPTIDEIKGQTLALTPVSASPAKKTYYAPLSEIKSVRL